MIHESRNQKYIKQNKNENITHQSECAAKVVLRRQFIALSVYVIEEGMFQICGQVPTLRN